MVHLVTGGSGFLGNLIARRLLVQGKRVKVLDIWKDPTLPSEIEYIDCDVRNAEGVQGAMGGVEVVHHNAARVPLTKSVRGFREVNVDGSRVVAEAAVKAGVKAFVHMSSSAVFGTPTCPVTDETACRPIEAYGESKLAGELVVREICGKANLPLIVVRPRTIVSKERLGIFQILFDWIHGGHNIYVIGSGNNRFQFVHTEDMMDAYMLALRSQKPGLYNVGTDRFGTVREALETLVAHAQTRTKVKSLPASLAIGALRTLDALRLCPLSPWHYLTYHKPFYFEITKLTALGWKPRYSNDEMLRESYNWFVEQFDRSQAAGAGAHRKPVKERLLWLLKKIS